jgi:hypothetical protein
MVVLEAPAVFYIGNTQPLPSKLSTSGPSVAKYVVDVQQHTMCIEHNTSQRLMTCDDDDDDDASMPSGTFLVLSIRRTSELRCTICHNK